MKLFKCLFMAFLFSASAAFSQYNLVIVGGNPGGIMSAISAAKLGKTSVILERTGHIGGLPANGLGATDIATRGATTGLFTEFTGRIKKYYIKKYGENAEQVKMCSDGYHFEPSVAELIFEEMLAEHSDKIKVYKMRQFDAEEKNVSMQNNKITKIKVTNRLTKQTEEYQGDIFIDGTYEGDLAAAAKVPFRTGREGKDEFAEDGAGRTYKYWDGPVAEGTTYQADNAVQAYNYRLCLTDDASNRLTVTKPRKYDRDEFKSLVNDVWDGRHTGVEMLRVSAEMMAANRKNIAKGDTTGIPGDKWGIAKITNRVFLPNHKTDANNQHLALISTDLPEENWPWPTSGWDWRDQFAERLKSYTLGLIYFAQNDPKLPVNFKKAAGKWGLAKDEYQDNENFPRQVYVREGRRMEGAYFFTAQDAIALTPGARPPLHVSSITASHYALDSHAVRKRESGKIHLDGFISYLSDVYTVPFGVMLPKDVDNLLFPVPVSGSHIGFSTLRMEPCWMAIGQAAGIAASLAIDEKLKLKNVDLNMLQDKLIDQKATLIYYKDIRPDDQDFKMVQYMGLRGYLPDWEARLPEAMDVQTAKLWQAISGIEIKAEPNLTRGQKLKGLYQLLVSRNTK
ncbi:FAD-dependent oxidoreductase [Pedobacter sp. MC2016-24]|nr:FAD-dependent oxidoreductase [Pedobacter sp. MC2016-24]